MQKTTIGQTNDNRNILNEQALLRLHAEPCSFYSEMQVHRTLMEHLNAFMNTLERFYYAWDKDEQIVSFPAKQVFTNPGLKGDYRVMPCSINGFEGKVIKAVKIIGTNEEEEVIQDKIAVGKALLLHPKDNFVAAIFDVCALSAFRTAAISVLAFKHTGDFDRQKIGLIGTGRIGFYTAAILYHWLGVKELMICDVKTDRRYEFKQVIKQWIPRIKEGGLVDVCQSCTAVFLATTSTSPLISENNAQKLDFISSVGADAENLSELNSSLLNERKIISESRQNIHFGDLNRWHKAGLLKQEDVIELRDVIGQTEKGKERIVFVSTGTAIQDALLCQFLFERIK